MEKVLPCGNPKSPIWIICEKPYEKDHDKGYFYSSPTGYVFNRCFSDSGIEESPFILGLNNSFIATDIHANLNSCLSQINLEKPPIILTMGSIVTALFCPQTIQRSKKGHKLTKGVPYESSLEKYAGSLLISPLVSHPHYIIPQLAPHEVIANWEYKFIYTNIDLGHVKEELKFYNSTGTLQQLTVRNISIQPNYNDLVDILYEFYNAKYISNDIETIRPTEKSELYGKHPGYLYTIGLASSPYRAVSFCPWKYSPEEMRHIFSLCNYIFKNIPQIGQNFFSFDSHFYEAMGFEVCLNMSHDTMLRHQILWPELSHKLQFLTKQYTREPFYKDEGKSWSPKALDKLLRYNALDAAVTYEVFLGQEKEFDVRPYLK